MAEWHEVKPRDKRRMSGIFSAASKTWMPTSIELGRKLHGRIHAGAEKIPGVRRWTEPDDLNLAPFPAMAHFN
jgi:hypothetical protein